ncbi:hypothetical protein [Halorussus marinus]|uniref:hypothetical protein n=1 Tax=Halorussus marinus TaxID=2505976 RepID=UPI00106EDBB2|nr:hypothetical protein [Halorussus marinus]
MADPLDPFPDVDDEADRALVARHQEAVRALPALSVEDLVYDYRTQFHRDPLVARTDAAYYLSVRSHVWAEFGERLDAGPDGLSRLKAIHAEQFREHVGEQAADDAMILTRE